MRGERVIASERSSELVRDVIRLRDRASKAHDAEENVDKIGNTLKVTSDDGFSSNMAEVHADLLGEAVDNKLGINGVVPLTLGRANDTIHPNMKESLEDGNKERAAYADEFIDGAHFLGGNAHVLEKMICEFNEFGIAFLLMLKPQQSLRLIHVLIHVAYNKEYSTVYIRMYTEHTISFAVFFFLPAKKAVEKEFFPETAVSDDLLISTGKNRETFSTLKSLFR